MPKVNDQYWLSRFQSHRTFFCLYIDGKHLSKIETGVHLPTYKTLKKLSEILNFNLQDMDSISDKDKMTDHNPIYQKSLKLLNSAKNDKELKNYYNALKFTNRLMNNK